MTTEKTSEVPSGAGGCSLEPLVRALWNCIISFANAEACVEGQGNSGEFYDEKEEAIAHKYRDKARDALCNQFALVTGWMPYRVTTVENDGEDKWELRPNAKLTP